MVCLYYEYNNIGIALVLFLKKKKLFFIFIHRRNYYYYYCFIGFIQIVGFGYTGIFF